MVGTVSRQQVVVAHRGAHRHGPGSENSMRAFRDVLTKGFARFECDLLPSADDEVLVVHGPRSGHGGGVPADLVIVESSWAQLSRVRLAEAESLPRLTELLRLVADHEQVEAVLELKDTGLGHARNLAFAGRVAQLVQASDAAARVEFISFDYAMLLELRRLDPAARCSPLEHEHSLERYLADGMYGVDFDHEAHFSSPGEIETYQRAGLVVNTWTVNERARMQQLLRWGIDRITTDEPELLASLAAEASGPRP